ncbi:MAG: DUF485 domain-containing protein [Hydrogenimonas sp.]|nr:DUF485 domain-containing protein [Hydrogenimonas sp.]
MLNGESARSVANDESYIALVKKRGRFAWSLAAAISIIYFSFISLIAFYPQVLSIKVFGSNVITLGIPVGIGVIFCAFALTGIYVLRANREFDRLNRELLKRHKERSEEGDVL